MGFIEAMDSRGVGENGAPELTAKGVGEPLVALFFKLVRGMPEATLRELMAACTKAGSASSYADVVVLAFQSRATRGMGKGEKDVFYRMLARLPHPYELSDAEEWIALQPERRRSGTEFCYGVTLDDRLIGSCGTLNLDDGSYELGYWIGEPYARRGYMTEALASLLPFIFENLRLHRIEAAVLPENAASRALLKKVGFREEGYARQFLRINGEWQDHVLFGMLAGDPRPVVHTVIEGGRELRPAVAPSGAFAVSSVAAPSQNTVGGRNSSTA